MWPHKHFHFSLLLFLAHRTAAKEIRDTMGCDSFIVGITGNVFQEDIAYFKYCGANCILPKPLQIGRLETVWAENGGYWKK
jgi:hypothetical protein